MPNVRRFLLSLAVLGVALPAGQAAAQNVARTYWFTPPPGKTAAFEQALKSHVAWRNEAGDPWSWSVYQVVNGEKLGTFMARSDGHAWADLDAYDGGFGPKGSERFGADVAPHLATETSLITVADTAHMILPDEPEGYAMVEVVTFHLKADQAQAFDRAIDRVHKAIVASKWPVHYAWEMPVNGGRGEDRLLAIFHPDWADFEPTEPSMEAMLAEQLGQDQAMELFRSMAGSYWETTSMVLRYRPDLSIVHGGM
jgi:hypothetical protein